MSALDTIARGLALAAAADRPRTFAEFQDAILPPVVDRIETVGHTDPGLGAATYVADQLATPALAATHPAACVTVSGGRVFRLAGTPDGYVTPEMFGCGHYAAGINQQPQIQAAIDYCVATGLQGVRFPAGDYELWSPPRTGYAPGNGYDTTVHTGHFILVNGAPVSLVGRTGRRTTLHCKGPTGGNLQTDYQTVVVDGYGGECIWRGAGVFMTGSASSYGPRPAEGDLSHVAIRDIVLKSDAVGVRNVTWPAWPRSRDASGVRENCWDISNKGIWFENDKHVGDLSIENCAIHGFLGEVIYTSGTYAGPDEDVGTTVRVRDFTAKDSNAQAINPNGPNALDIDGLTVENCGFAWEGWGGISYSRIVNALFRKCNSAGVGGSNTYDYPLRADGRQPLCLIDITCDDCGDFYLGSYVQGRLKLIDTSLALVAQSPTMAIKNNVVDVTIQVHGRNLTQAVRFSGNSAAGSKLVTNNDIRLRVVRTREGQAAGYWTTFLCNQSGSLGTGNVLRLSGHGGTIGTVSDITDNYVGIVDDGIDFSNGTFGTTFDPTASGYPELGCGWNRLLTFAAGWTNAPINLPSTAAFPHNAEIVIEHRDNANQQRLAEVRYGGQPRCLVGYQDMVKLRCNKYRGWDLVSAVRPRSANASIDIAPTAVGEESGPYAIPASGCRTHHRVSVSLPLSGTMPAGLVVTAVRAETDAVKFWVRNSDGASTLDPPVQSFTARWWIDPA